MNSIQSVRFGALLVNNNKVTHSNSMSDNELSKASDDIGEKRHVFKDALETVLHGDGFSITEKEENSVVNQLEAQGFDVVVETGHSATDDDSKDTFNAVKLFIQDHASGHRFNKEGETILVRNITPTVLRDAVYYALDEMINRFKGPQNQLVEGLPKNKGLGFLVKKSVPSKTYHQA